MMQGCDTLLMIGSASRTPSGCPSPARRAASRSTSTRGMLGIRFPMEVNLAGRRAGDAAGAAAAGRAASRPGLAEEIEDETDSWWRDPCRRGRARRRPVNPELVFHELSARLPDGCILTADSGSATNWWARHLQLRRGHARRAVGDAGDDGPGVPYALAAKFVYPNRPVIAVQGDGAMQMNGINAADRRREIRRSLDRPALRRARAQQPRPQPGHLGAARAVGRPEARVLADDPRLPLRPYAELLGLAGIRVDAPDAVGARLGRALRGRPPRRLEAIADPEVPPLPPHIDSSRPRTSRRHCNRDPGARDIIRQSLKGKAQDLFNR